MRASGLDACGRADPKIKGGRSTSRHVAFPTVFCRPSDRAQNRLTFVEAATTLSFGTSGRSCGPGLLIPATRQLVAAK